MDKMTYEQCLSELNEARTELESYLKHIFLQAKKERQEIKNYIKQQNENLDIAKKKFEEDKKNFYELKEAYDKVFKERQIGFPWIVGRINDATEIICKNSYQRSQEYNLREIKKERDVYKGIIDFYEHQYPYLKELREIECELDLEEQVGYSESERKDESHYFLTPDEYRSKSSVERNQLALDRYKKRTLSKWEIGKMYERYIGFLKEEEGYSVDYDGIKYRLEDRGRDLICTKGDEIQIIQCKMWSLSKHIYENSIFQFFGTVYYAREEERKQNPFAPRNVRGLFYTTTDLSDYALKAAQEIGIEIVKEKMNKDYPCIKCNINNGEKIYHLPFDQQYDHTIIKANTGEFYASTCAEAESKGFRRALRHNYSTK